MSEENALGFYERVVSEEKGESRERVLEHASGHKLTVEISGINRKAMLDQVNRLPDSLLSTLSEAEDPEEAEERAQEEGQLSSVNGETIDAFERICAMGMDHPELTSHQFEELVQKFELDVLFPIGAEIMELTFSDDSGVVDFHEVE